MTNEIEKTFFNTFGIEPIGCNDNENCRKGEINMRFLKTLKYWILVKTSKLAGIDDFSCDEHWTLNKSAWSDCYHYLAKEGKQ